MRASYEEMRKQMYFISELVERLKKEIAFKDTEKKYSRIRGDIVRARRELDTLSKMTKWEWSEQKKEGKV